MLLVGDLLSFLFRIRGMNHQQGYPKPAEAKQEAISNGLKQPMKTVNKSVLLDTTLSWSPDGRSRFKEYTLGMAPSQ